MSNRKSSRIASLAVFTAIVATPQSGFADPQTKSSPPASVSVEVKYTDDSTMKLKVLDDKLELETKHGKLQIAMTDVRRIEFAGRTTPEVAEKIALAISNLGHIDFATREQASAMLQEYGERAYPALVKATKHPDPEVGRRADEGLKFLNNRISPNRLEPRELDIIHTDDSKISGRLTKASFRVMTFQFGELQLKLADLRSLKAANVTDDTCIAAVVAPANLMTYQNQFGKELMFTLTAGKATGQGNGVWGTELYTLDSNLAVAAIHSGVLQPGQTGTVKVRIVNSPPQFVASSRNGVDSAAYGHYPSGAFEFVRK